MNTERAQDRISILVGTTVTDTEGKVWVFIGWSVNTQGQSMVFVESMNGSKMIFGRPYVYYASFLQTLLARFPSLYEFVVS